MDPFTVFLTATLLILLNGGVLGLIHRDLPAELRPSAVSWRIATLLQAGGCIILATQLYLPPALALPLAFGLVTLGIAGYWRALRQFYARRDRLLLLLPVLCGTFAIWWFTAVHAQVVIRAWVASVCWIALLGGCALELRRAGQRGAPARSRSVLGLLCLVLAVFMLVRGVYYTQIGEPGVTVLDFRNPINIVTPLLLTILPVIGTTAFLLLCSDRIRRQSECAAATDDLTGLPNRRSTALVGTERIAAARRSGLPLAVAVIDIDHFKRINDEFGHEVGDLALRHVAHLIASSLGQTDVAGRQGGEEFVALLSVTTPTQAGAIAEAIRAQVRDQPFRTPAGAARVITVSVGVAMLQAQDQSLEDVLHRADQAVYLAKSQGRDQVVLV